MAQRQTIAWAELRVGILVIVSFALLLVALFFIGGETGFLTSKYSFTVYFPSALGLKQGAEVWFEGVTVGNVSTVQIVTSDDPNRSVAVLLRIDERFKSAIREDSEATIGTIGLLGDRNVSLTRGSGKAVEDGGVLQGRPPDDIERVIKGTNDILANIQTLSEQFSKMSERIERGEGTLGKLLSDSAIYDNANEAVREAALLVKDARTGPGTIGRLMTDDSLYSKIDETIGRVDTMIAKIESGEGTLGKFVNDSSLYNRADQLVARLQNIIQRVERGEGTLGKLASDQQLYDELRATVSRVGSLVKQIEEGEGTAGRLIRDPALYNNLNQTSSEIMKLLYDFRQDPRKFLTINFKLF